ncbi:MAG: TolC family protein [Bryobacteraceae bacterium]
MHRVLLSTIFWAIPVTVWAADATPPREPLRLTLRRAVEIATSPEGNTYIQLSDESVRQAKSRTTEARSAFLPDIEARASQTTAMKSLAALGLDLATNQTLTAAESGLGTSCKGAACAIVPAEQTLLNDIIKDIPRVVGPFTSVDVRATLTEDLIDFSNIRRYQASRAALRATKQDRANTDDTVSSTVAKAYLAALRSDADVEAYQANVALAEAVLKQSENQKNAGTGTGIEVTRSKVQLSNEKQHLLSVQNERTKAYLQLLRVMGLNLATELELTDKLSYEPTEAVTVEQAQAEALKNRPDVKAQIERETAAHLSANSVKYERLPSLVAFADYGTTGTNGNIVSLLPTRDYGFALRVPIFDGGRRDARRSEAFSQFRQERIRANDIREQIELDIRTALDSLHNAEEQLKVAEEGLTLSDSELTQARRRYAAGVASSLEVTDAQTRLDRARDNRIAALFGYNVARVDLGHAMGNVRRMIQ